ncbi:MAG: AAA family ATPase [Armatimonadota bacterium]
MSSPADEHVTIREITLRNILSFGPETPPLTLGALNVLIGPNGSGKSNLLEAIGLLRATAGDFQRAVILYAGGVDEWIWKGAPDNPASVEVVVNNPTWLRQYDQPEEWLNLPEDARLLRHGLSFAKEDIGFHIEDEYIETAVRIPNAMDAWKYYHYDSGSPVILAAGELQVISPGSLSPANSILSQRKDPERYPEISYIAGIYEKIRLYREWPFGRNAVFRGPQKADMRNDRLEENYSNLGLYLNKLRRNPKAKRAILIALRDLYEGLTDFDVSVEAGTVQVFFTENDFTIPATRLSDGTLRYLFLSSVLNDPEPPPLICIEEPELGLHPDILPKLADLLVSASERTQLIVTTHSDILVDALSTRPEAVIVCEKHEGQTTMRRLDSDALVGWLEKYTLGQLWTRGELGGTRW